jgi:trehalose 6-phosphate phosphatase
MQDLLARGRAEVLAQLAHSKVLLAFDFDGTLAPIVPEPNDARMRPRTRALLARVCELYPCAVVSGRSRRDLRPRLGGALFRAVVGNHGLEPWAGSEVYVRRVQRWLPGLREALADFKGVVIEDKFYSVAVHYRHSRQKRKARAAIFEAAAAIGTVRVIGGHQVVNLLPEGAPHKGIAVRSIRDRLGCDTVFFIGDDETDEDVFGLDDPGRLLGVRVGRSPRSRASFFIRDQRKVDALLATMIALRPGPRAT